MDKRARGEFSGLGYPCAAFWEIAAKTGVRAIIGFDAHKLQHLWSGRAMKRQSNIWRVWGFRLCSGCFNLVSTAFPRALAIPARNWYDSTMEKKECLILSAAKSLLVWLSALVMTASAVLRIAYSCGKGADAATVWFQIVLPVAACLIFVLMILLGGQERFYHTAIPAFLLAIYYSVRVSAVLTSLSLRFVFWVAYLAIAGFYAMTVSGRVRNNWALVLLLCRGDRLACLHAQKRVFRRQLVGARGLLPELLFLTGGLFAVLAMQPYADGNTTPRGRPR